MIYYKDPVMSTTTKGYDVNNLKKVGLLDQSISMPMIVMMSSQGDNPDESVFKYIPLNRESRKYIHIKLKNVIKNYNRGKLQKTVNEYQLKLCNINNFRNS